MANKLDRIGTTQAFVDMLKNDTGTLYGNDKLLNFITADPVLFDKERLNNITPWGLFCWIEDSDPVEERSNNSYDDFLVTLKLKVLGVKYFDIIQKLDDAIERIKVLTRNEMRSSGQKMTEYYSDDNAQIYNIEPTISVLPPPEDNTDGAVVINATGAILIQINRW